MLEFIYRLYATIFGRKLFYKFNKFIYHLSLRGMGILNFEPARLSGEESFISNYLSDISSGVIFDVGANVGDYSRKLRITNSKIDIYSFEPHPITFDKLRDNTKKLNINIFNLGIGSTEGTLKLYDYAENDGSSHASLYKKVIEGIHRGKSVEHEVKIITLEDFSTEHKIDRVHLLKIDTEGHEMEVLKGFESFIRNNKVDLIQFEFNEMNIESRVLFKDFWDFLPNYDFYRMLPDGLISIKNYCPIFCEIFGYQNIVAILKQSFRQS